MTKRIPKQARSVAKYEKIIRTTRRIIETDAFLTTSTHQIARKAGVGVGTLYEYFESKEDILLALLDYEARDMWRQVEARIPDWIRMDTISALEEFATLMVTLADEHRGLVKVMLGQVPGVLGKEPVVRILGQGEMLVKLLMGLDPDISRSRKTDTNAFIVLNALIGLLLGIANGLPPTVSHEALSEQISRLLGLIVENREVVL